MHIMINRKNIFFFFFFFLLILLLLIILFFNNRHYYPNIFLITIDTLRADHLSCYGYKNNTTPNIDELSKNGILYENTYAQAPVTLVSHASILTGLYPFNHGCRNNGDILDKNVITLAEVLKKYSYNTGGFVGSAVLHSKTQINQGFDTFDDNFNSYIKRNNQEIYDLFYNSSSNERIANQTNLQVFKWLKQVKKSRKPFFLWVHYWDPHFPYSPPIPYTKYSNNQIQQYDAEISYVDDSVGELLRTIKSSDKKRNTLIVLTADHGENLGEHGFFAEHGLNLYEPVLKIPLIIEYPPYIQGGRRIIDDVQSIDIFPTILDLIGAKYENIDGKSLFKQATSNNDEEKIIYFDTMWADEQWIGIKVGNWKYTISSKGKSALYEINKDPYELVNYCNEKEKDIISEENTKSYTRIGSSGITSYFYIPTNKINHIKEAILFLEDIDAWGTGSKGSATDVAIKLNKANWVYQSPRKSKLKDSPGRNEFRMPINELIEGINQIIVKDDMNKFEAIAIKGELIAAIKIIYEDGNEYKTELINSFINNLNIEEINNKDALIERIKKAWINILGERKNTKSIYDISEDTKKRLKSLGYIK